MKYQNPLDPEVKEFLDNLRESGVTNMFGAAPYIQEGFGVDKKDAKELLMQWMEEY